MRILYLKGDTPCYNYPKCIREGFSYYEFCKIEMDEDPNETDCIWFVTEGELEVSCNGEKTKILAGNMICFSRGSICRIFSRGKATVVIAQFDNIVQSCEKILFSQLNSLSFPGEKAIYPLEIRTRLQMFLKLLIGYLKDGANCVHFHETKLKELFWNI